MRKMVVVFKREYLQAVRRKMFIFMTFAFPALMAALMVIPSFLMMRGLGEKRGDDSPVPRRREPEQDSKGARQRHREEDEAAAPHVDCRFVAEDRGVSLGHRPSVARLPGRREPS